MCKCFIPDKCMNFVFSCQIFNTHGMKILIKHIKSLVNIQETPYKWVAGKDMETLNTLEDA